jgi:hypothetical protein
MGTATSEAAAAALAAIALTLSAGCGGAGQPARRATAAGASFAAVRAASPPAAWRPVRIPTGAVLFYPPTWRRAAGDAGTGTAVLEGAGRQLLGYLNITPQQSDETLSNWPRFRVAHNAEEGDRDVRSEASAEGVRFRTGIGTCVRDRYTTKSGARYIELACIVKGTATSVIIAASPPEDWGRVSPVLYRALSAMTT